MRAQVFLAVVSILVCMALLMIILSQRQLLTTAYRENEKVPMQLERLRNERSQLDSTKLLLEKMMIQGKKTAEDLEAEVAKIRPGVEKTKTEIDACQAGKKTKEDELAAMEKELTDTGATLKAESDAWNQEITKLKAQVIAYRPICDFVKEEEKAKTSCGAKA